MTFLISVMGEDPIELEALYRAAPERVFRSWTEPEQFRRWFGSEESGPLSVEIDLKVGGAWRAVFADGPEGRSYLEGAYTAIEPARLLAFTWRHVQEKPGAERQVSPDSEVTVTLEAEGEATRLKLRHVGVARRSSRENIGPGWNASFEKLERLIRERVGV